MIPWRGAGHGTAVLLVAVGGFLGAGARYGIGSEWESSPPGFPWATFAINVVGACVLGALLTALVQRGPDTGRRRHIRLLCGTGFLGAFTTYSSLAVDTDMLFHDDKPVVALLYALGSVVLGLVAALGGVVAALRLGRRLGGGR